MHQEKVNGSKAEAVVDTLVYTQIEVPNTTGATLVMLDYCEMDLVPPAPVSGTTVSRDAVLIVGKVVPTTAKLSESGAVAARHITLWNEAAAAVATACYSAGEEPMGNPVVLVKNPQDGKYYVTIAVVGNNEGVGDFATVHYHLRFRVK